jgi:hypothetical protein
LVRLIARLRTSFDLVSETNLPVRQYVGPQAAPVDQPRDHAGPRQSLKVHTWLAKALTERANWSDTELPTDQRVEVDSPSDQVPSRLGSGELGAVCERKLIEHLGFDERYVISAQPRGPWREGAGLSRISISQESPLPLTAVAVARAFIGPVLTSLT